MNYNTLRTAIAAAIKTPADPKISGAILQQQLINIVNALDLGSLYMGIASTNTVPNAEANGFYFALQEGTYTNFLNSGSTAISVSNGEIAILVKSGNAWAKEHMITMPYIDPITKNWIVNGQDSGVVAEGQNGANGVTPHIGGNGDWFIGETDTGVQAEGQDAVNPFKGLFVTTSDPNIPATGQAGDYIFIADAKPATTIDLYYWNTDANPADWANTGFDIDPASLAQFANGPAVSMVQIINDLITGGTDNVLSAEQGKVIKTLIDGTQIIERKGNSNIAWMDGTGCYVGNLNEIATQTTGNYYGFSAVKEDTDYEYTWRNVKSSSNTLPYYLLFVDDTNTILAQFAPKDTTQDGILTARVHSPIGATKAITMSAGNSSTWKMELYEYYTYEVKPNVGLLLPDERLELINARYIQNQSTYSSQKYGTYSIKVNKGDKISIFEANDKSWQVYFTDTKPTPSGNVGNTNSKYITTPASVRNTGLLIEVPAEQDGEYLVISGQARNITQDITVYLNGKLMSINANMTDDYSDVKEHTLGEIARDSKFVYNLELLQGTFSNSNETHYCKMRYPIEGRCIVTLASDYVVCYAKIINKNTGLDVRTLIIGPGNMNNLFVFNYYDNIRLCFSRKDGGVINSSEYNSIITKIEPIEGGYPYSPSDLKEYALCAPDVKAFINEPAYPDGDYTVSYVSQALNNGTFDILPYERCLPVTLDWTPVPDANHYIVILDTQTGGAVTMSNTPHFVKTNHIDLYNLLPNTTYNYVVCVVRNDGTTDLINYDRFSTENFPLRIINMPDVCNMRDLGGWSAANNKKVKYRRIYRAAALSRKEGFVIDGVGIDNACRFLNIVKEIGLGVNYGIGAITRTTAYVDYPIGDYDGISASMVNCAKILGEIIDSLNGDSSYSVVFHCAGGADRTGTLSWLLLGLLGVSESDMSKDYELTSFTKSLNRRVRDSNASSGNLGGLYDYINRNFAGATLQAKIEDWWTQALTAANMSTSLISTFKTLMLV